MANVIASLGSNTLIAAGQTGTTTTDLLQVHAQERPIAGIAIVVNIATYVSGTLTVVVNGVTANSYVYALLTSAALGAAATTALLVSRGGATTTNVSANAPIPYHVQVVATSSSFSGTYGIDYVLSC